MVTKKLKHIKHYSREQKETRFHLHLQRKDSSQVLPSASSTCQPYPQCPLPFTRPCTARSNDATDAHSARAQAHEQPIRSGTYREERARPANGNAALTAERGEAGAPALSGALPTSLFSAVPPTTAMFPPTFSMRGRSGGEESSKGKRRAEGYNTPTKKTDKHQTRTFSSSPPASPTPCQAPGLIRAHARYTNL